MTDTWRRSSRCESHTCVEVAMHPGGTFVRDSKKPAAGRLVFDRAAWTAFLRSVRTRPRPAGPGWQPGNILGRDGKVLTWTRSP